MGEVGETARRVGSDVVITPPSDSHPPFALRPSQSSPSNIPAPNAGRRSAVPLCTHTCITEPVHRPAGVTGSTSPRQKHWLGMKSVLALSASRLGPEITQVAL